MPRIFKRKFLVSGFPDLESSFECSIKQSYLACGDREIRITRRTINQALVDKMRIKTQETPLGEEIEFSIRNEVFDNILATIKEPVITKYHRRYHLFNYKLDYTYIDDNFYICEVEFRSEREAQLFDCSLIPNFIKEITSDDRFKMKYYWTVTRLEGKQFKVE